MKTMADQAAFTERMPEEKPIKIGKSRGNLP